MGDPAEQVAQISKRKADGFFTTIANEALRDARLSYRARGVLAACLTHTKEFRLTRQWIDAHGTEGRDTITKAIHELRELGYVHDEWTVEGETTTRRMVWSDHTATPMAPRDTLQTLDTTENQLQLKSSGTENQLQLKTSRTLRRSNLLKKINKKENPPIPPEAEEGEPAAVAAPSTPGKVSARFRAKTGDIPAGLLPVEQELLSFWAEKAGTSSQRAWRVLLTELEKIQHAPGGGTEVVREQLNQATQAGWRSVTHTNWLAYGQKRQSGQQRPMTKTSQAVANVAAFLRASENQSIPFATNESYF